MAKDKTGSTKHDESRRSPVRTETAHTQITSLSTSFDLPLPGRTVVYPAKKDDIRK